MGKVTPLTPFLGHGKRFDWTDQLRDSVTIVTTSNNRDEKPKN